MSDFAGVMSTIIPMFSAANNANRINEMSTDLEQWTVVVDNTISYLRPELKALGTLTLQNLMALDLLLAEQGGTCKVMGDSCCTWTPDASDNLTS